MFYQYMYMYLSSRRDLHPNAVCVSKKVVMIKKIICTHFNDKKIQMTNKIGNYSLDTGPCLKILLDEYN